MTRPYCVTVSHGDFTPSDRCRYTEEEKYQGIVFGQGYCDERSGDPSTTPDLYLPLLTFFQILIGSLDRRPNVKSLPKISRLLFPETGAMGISRNDLYITLDSLKTTRSSESLQLSLILRDGEGNIIPVTVSSTTL